MCAKINHLYVIIFFPLKLIRLKSNQSSEKNTNWINFYSGCFAASIVEGFVVANDMDNKRCYLMTHQVKRIQSPNCMIINHDARILPNMRLSKDEVGLFTWQIMCSHVNQYLVKYD